MPYAGRSGRAAVPERQRPLPVEIVAEILVAIARIEPEAAVERERRIEVLDPLAGVGDLRRRVDRARRLGQPDRRRALNRGDVRPAAAARGEPAALHVLGWLLSGRLLLRRARGTLRAAH